MAPPRIIDADTIARASRRIAAGQPWREAAADIPMSVGALQKRVKRYRRDYPGSEISDKSRIAVAASTPPQSGHESGVLPKQNIPSGEPSSTDERLLLTDPELPRAPLRHVVHDTRIESAREQRARTGGSSSSGGSRPIQRHPEGGRVRKVFTTGTDGAGNGWESNQRSATDAAPAHYLDRYGARNPKGVEMRLRDERGLERGHEWVTVRSALELRAQGWEWIGGVQLPNAWDVADEYGVLTCDCGEQFPSQGALLRHRDLHHAAA